MYSRRVLASVLLMLAASGSLAADQVTLAYQTFAAEHGSDWRAVFRQWAKRVEADAQGRLRIAPARDLVTGVEPPEPKAGTESAPAPPVDPLVERVRSQKLDVAWIRIDGASGRFARVALFEWPFLVSESGAASRALWEYVQTYAPDEFKDLHLLALHVRGADVIQSKLPLAGRAMPFEGAHVATVTASVSALAKAAGAVSATLLADTEPVTGAQGVPAVPADIVIAPVVAGSAAWPHHVVQAEGQAAIGTETYALVMNQTSYDALPDDLKKVIDRHSGGEVSAWFGQQMRQLSYRQKLPSAPISVEAMSPVVYENLRKAAMDAEKAWLAEKGSQGQDLQKLLDGARTLIRQHTR
ncbi:MAG: hypothetical protein R3E68_17040 [Burkholderiaceae bacterium]